MSRLRERYRKGLFYGSSEIGEKMKVGLNLPTCKCGSKNLKIWGTRIADRVNVEVRCMACGRVLTDHVEELKAATDAV